MNPILRTQVEQLERLVADIESQVDELEARYTKERERADHLRAQYWSRSKSLSVLQDSAKRLEEVQAENERFRKAHVLLEERLTRVLNYAKALGAEFRE